MYIYYGPFTQPRVRGPCRPCIDINMYLGERTDLFSGAGGKRLP